MRRTLVAVLLAWAACAAGCGGQGTVGRMGTDMPPGGVLVRAGMTLAEMNEATGTTWRCAGIPYNDVGIGGEAGMEGILASPDYPDVQVLAELRFASPRPVTLTLREDDRIVRLGAFLRYVNLGKRWDDWPGELGEQAVVPQPGTPAVADLWRWYMRELGMTGPDGSKVDLLVPSVEPEGPALFREQWVTVRSGMVRREIDRLTGRRWVAIDGCDLGEGRRVELLRPDEPEALVVEFQTSGDAGPLPHDEQRIVSIARLGIIISPLMDLPQGGSPPAPAPLKAEQP